MRLVDGMRPNGFSEAVKRRFLGEVEGKVRVELLGEEPGTVPVMDENTPADTELTAPTPFDQLYLLYVMAMMDHVEGDTARYENTAILFNAVFQSYGKWLKRRGA
jgi:hypothetical protein